MKLSPKQQLRLETLRKIHEQQKYMYDNHTHSVSDRIVSVSQPCTGMESIIIYFAHVLYDIFVIYDNDFCKISFIVDK